MPSARLVIVDNVFSTPSVQRALEQGADVVVYSATKHIDGQGRVLGGVILGTREFIRKTVEPYLKHTGGAMSPFTAWVMLKGLETLRPARPGAGGQRAGRSPRRLEGDARLARVIYPGLASHPQHDLAHGADGEAAARWCRWTSKAGRRRRSGS